MSTFTIESTLSHRSLMNKSKSDIADTALLYVDLNGHLHAEIERLEGLIKQLSKEKDNYRRLWQEAHNRGFKMETALNEIVMLNSNEISSATTIAGNVLCPRDRHPAEGEQTREPVYRAGTLWRDSSIPCVFRILGKEPLNQRYAVVVCVSSGDLEYMKPGDETHIGLSILKRCEEVSDYANTSESP